MLDREEYIEQAYLFRLLNERTQENVPTQDLLESLGKELLATSKLPLALSFLASEMRLRGVFATAMAQLPHYFTQFQTFVVNEAEREEGRFDIRTAWEILRREAEYRAAGASPQGLFLYQLECLSRNRLGIEKGLAAVAADPIFDDAWKEWIDFVRRQVGFIDMADLIYVRSEHHARMQADALVPGPDDRPPLFGEREGKIALANRRRDPAYLFAALHRHLSYPEPPRPPKADPSKDLVPQLQRRLERLEQRLKMLEEEVRQGGIDITRFYRKEE